jgi:hypothetical protein
VSEVDARIEIEVGWDQSFLIWLQMLWRFGVDT